MFPPLGGPGQVALELVSADEKPAPVLVASEPAGAYEVIDALGLRPEEVCCLAHAEERQGWLVRCFRHEFQHALGDGLDQGFIRVDHGAEGVPTRSDRNDVRKRLG